MKRVRYLLLAMALLATSGCATKEYVRTQIEPLESRLGRIEARLTEMENKLAQPPKPSELSAVDKAALKDALETAKQALDAAGKAQASAENAEAAAKRAENAATRAEAAVITAETAAKKCEKMFELQQKK